MGHFKSSKEFYELTQLLRPFVGGEVPLAQRKSKNIQERPPDTFRGTTHRVLRLPRGCGQYGPQLKFQTSEQSGTEWRVQESDSLCFLSRQMDQMRNSQFNWFAKIFLFVPTKCRQEAGNMSTSALQLYFTKHGWPLAFAQS